jgi:hypothetical protein
MLVWLQPRKDGRVGGRPRKSSDGKVALVRYLYQDLNYSLVRFAPCLGFLAQRSLALSKGPGEHQDLKLNRGYSGEHQARQSLAGKMGGKNVVTPLTRLKETDLHEERTHLSTYDRCMPFRCSQNAAFFSLYSAYSSFAS